MKANLKLISLAFFFTFSNYNFLKAQKQSRVGNYFRYLVNTNSDKKEFYLGHANATISYMLPGKMNNIGHGVVFDIGLNLARFFTKKINIGLFVGNRLGGSGGNLLNYKYTNEYRKTFNDNLYYNNLNHIDSNITYILEKNVVKKNTTFGTYSKYGLMFSIPLRFFPLIKIYKSNHTELFDIENFSGSNYYKHQEYLLTKYKGKGIDISFKVSDFFPKLTNTSLTFGAFYRQDYMTNAKIENVRYTTFLKPAFFERFGTIHRFGFKISAELY